MPAFYLIILWSNPGIDGLIDRIGLYATLVIYRGETQNNNKFWQNKYEYLIEYLLSERLANKKNYQTDRRGSQPIKITLF